MSSSFTPFGAAAAAASSASSVGSNLGSSPAPAGFAAATSAASMSATSALPPTLEHEIVTQGGVNSAVDPAILNVCLTMDAVHLGGAGVVGNNLVFLPGSYDPYSEAGRDLIFQSANTANRTVMMPGLPPLGAPTSSVPLTAGDEAGTLGGASGGFGGFDAAVAGAAAGLFRR
ncbi:MAG TPA: hypothetical protein VGL89_14985 [Candidatus Koribacter sp.]|jgi:hypothetical protein